MWVTTVAVTLQTILNTEAIRYTLYTGEPIFTGFMRTRPGPAFWGSIYTALYVVTAWPAWAGALAGAVFYLFTGRSASRADAGAVYAVGALAFLACAAILVAAGQRIERMLEVLNWAMVSAILVTLAVLAAAYVSPHQWLAIGLGFAGFDSETGAFRLLPRGADYFLLGAFAAYSGAGGLTNLALSNWVRDKGWGMASVVGYIPALVGGTKVRLAHAGSVFEPAPESLARWRGWWRLVRIDQWGIFFGGALLGMALPALLYSSSLPKGTDIRGLAVASELAHALATKHGAGLALIVALMSVWILFKTQLDVMDAMVRTITDLWWSGSGRLRRWQSGDVRAVYYAVLAAVVAWGLAAARLTQPIVLLQIGANIAGLVMTLSPLHILYVNTRLLPPPLRPPLWRRLGLVLTSVFYGCFVYLWLMGGFVPDPARGFLFELPGLLGLR